MKYGLVKGKQNCYTIDKRPPNRKDGLKYLPLFCTIKEAKIETETCINLLHI